ncbi:MAG: hypothetical protein NUW01_11700 [Gemmatimonadaceae bacterium]|nr:hypothetical protein [Gemmatimonadaceae bacterium]
MSERVVFPGAIDGRVRHAHRRYPGIDHGCEIDFDHAAPHECAPHTHEGTGHLIDVGRDAGIVYGPAAPPNGRGSAHISNERQQSEES